MHSQDTKNIIIVWWATILGGIVNYLVHPIAVRMLNTQAFGEFASLLSIVNIVWFIMGAWSIITLKLIAQHTHQSDHNIWSKSQPNLDFMYYLKHKLQRPLLGVGIVLWIIISICSPRIAQSLHISNPWWIIIIGISMITSVYSIILWAILQSGGWFTSLSIISVTWSLLRLWCVIGMLYLIWWTTWAIGATLIAGLGSFGITEYMVRKHLWHHNHEQLIKYDGTLIQEFKEQSRSYLNLIAITVMMWILTNSDVLIAQYVFGGEISWTYASIAVIAKFVIFIWLAAETVLLPKLLGSSRQTSISQIWSIILLMLWFGVVSLWGWRLLGWSILHLLKPWLEWYTTVLLQALTINRCILTISISSKSLINNHKTLPLWIVTVASIIWIIMSTQQTQLDWYLTTSIIIRWVATFLIQWVWLYHSIFPTTSINHHETI